MGTSRAACAVSGVPIESAALAFLTCRSGGGRWEPFSPATWVALDEYQNFVEYDGPPLELLSLWYPDAKDLWSELRSLRVEGPLKGPGGLELGLALVEPSIATAVERLARPRLPKREQALVALAFPRQGLQQAREEQREGVALLAAINLLGLELMPFESTSDAVPGHFGFEAVAACFESARTRLAAFPALGATVEDLRRVWAGEADEVQDDLEEDEDDEETNDEEVEATYGVTRSFLGVYTVTVPRALAPGLSAALSRGAASWENLSFQTPEPDGPSAFLRPLGAGFAFFLSAEAKASLLRALSVGAPWTSAEGEVVVTDRRS